MYRRNKVASRSQKRMYLVKSLRVAQEFAYACTRTSLYLSLSRVALNRRITKCETFGIASRSREFNEEITLVYKLTDPRERVERALRHARNDRSTILCENENYRPSIV